MRCKSFKIHKLSLWFIIAIAIVSANLSAGDAKGAERPDAVGKVLVVDSAPFFAALFNPTVTPAAPAQYLTPLGLRLAATPR